MSGSRSSQGGQWLIAFTIVLAIVIVIVGLVLGFQSLTALLPALTREETFTARLLTGLVGFAMTLVGGLAIGLYLWSLNPSEGRWGCGTVIGLLYIVGGLIWSPIYLRLHQGSPFVIVALDTALDVSFISLLIGVVAAVGAWKDRKFGAGCAALLLLPALLTGLYLCTVIVPTLWGVGCFFQVSHFLCH